MGSHNPAWLWKVDVPLFVSHRRLIRQLTYKPATTHWAMDSGGFSELSLFGEWTISPEHYIEHIKRYENEIGNLDWAAQQDWMCEPFIIEKTGLTVEEHQTRTIDNYITLQSANLNTPIIPVLQGFTLDEYKQHLDMWAKRNIILPDLPLVGIGSVCRRQHTDEIKDIIEHFTNLKLNLHGFGVKKQGLAKTKHLLTSADSMAWSYTARRDKPIPGHTHQKCSDCIPYALRWRESLLSS